MSGYTPERKIARSPAQQAVSAQAGAAKRAEGAAHRAENGPYHRRKKGERVLALKDERRDDRQLPLTLEGELMISKTGFDALNELADAYRSGPPPLIGVKSSKADSFPRVSEFDHADMTTAIRLMEEDIEYQAQEEAVRAARAEIKQGLAEIARRNAVPGMRHGQLVVYYAVKTRRTLDPRLLVEQGVSAETVAASYRASAPWEDVRVTDLSKPRKKRGDDDDGL